MRTSRELIGIPSSKKKALAIKPGIPAAESTEPNFDTPRTVPGRPPHSLPNPAGPYTGCPVGAARLRPTRMSPTCLCARTRLDIVGAFPDHQLEPAGSLTVPLCVSVLVVLADCLPIAISMPTERKKKAAFHARGLPRGSVQPTTWTQCCLAAAAAR